MFGLENLCDEKDMYPHLHREMFGRHISFYGFHLQLLTVFYFFRLIAELLGSPLRPSTKSASFSATLRGKTTGKIMRLWNLGINLLQNPPNPLSPKPKSN